MGNSHSKRQLNKVLTKPIPSQARAANSEQLNTQPPQPIQPKVEQEISKANLDLLKNMKITDVKVNLGTNNHLDILKSRRNQAETGVTVDTFDYKNSKYYNLPVFEGDRVVWK
ncbi:hypothetical protein HDV01_005503 [Terramyces sp. JEL0728]|nr:hypothetical protein HDV01_005503 [Terramyces sp. JEL0728]